MIPTIGTLDTGAKILGGTTTILTNITGLAGATVAFLSMVKSMVWILLLVLLLAIFVLWLSKKNYDAEERKLMYELMYPN